jgi:hypothetical protein
MAETAYPAVAEIEHEALTPAPVPFAELVHAHYRWRRARTGANEVAYRECLRAFEAEHGRIVNAYWCSNVESAVALTEKHLPRPLCWILGPRLAFHRVSDWATKGEPEIAAELHACDELAVRASHVLNGLRRRVCMQLVAAAATHLLSLVDARAAHEDDEKTKLGIEQERTELESVRRYYSEAANGQAQMVYFGGMAVAAAAGGGAACTLWLTLGHRNLFCAVIAGAIGAVVSVIQRITAGSFSVEYDVGRPYVLFLGGLRPAIGAVFGALLALAVASGTVKLPGDSTFAALLVAAFFSGFSERWAQDTLATALPTAARKPPASSGGADGTAP